MTALLDSPMILLLFFSLLGAIIGIAAAQKRGLHIAAGIIGGLLLGPLAVLMFLITPERKCPFCAETIKKEAKVCPHCQRDLPTDGKR